MTEILSPDLLWSGDHFASHQSVLIENGVIQQIGSPDELLAQAQDASQTRLTGQALVPGTINAHNHSFQSLVRGFGDDLPFFQWRDNGIYRYSLNLDEEGVYTGAILAFGEMLRYGVTTVVDFFYLHHESNTYDLAVMRAAQDVGIRLVLARCLYNWETGPAVYREVLEDAETRTRELAELARERDGGRGMLTVQPAPHSPHAASPNMIVAGHALAQELDTPFHIHVSEGRYEVEMIQERYGLTPIRWLDSLSVLDDRAVLVHAVWATPDEIELMGERGVHLAYNPASNMFLGDGITDIPAMLAAGVRVALGTDGGCSNNRTSIFDEMRTCALLQKVKRLDGATLSAEEVFTMGTANGGSALRLPIGEIAPGKRADLVALDINDISLQPSNRLIKNIVYAMSPQAIRGVWVDGTQRVSAGELTGGLSLREITTRVQALTANW
ncbi:MAG TPA: amidohydrolase, partial [Ktedonobacterales bacterium]|nr:amidohydrolase [Ktedonobacterales bacterium]